MFQAILGDAMILGAGFFIGFLFGVVGVVITLFLSGQRIKKNRSDRGFGN